MFFYTIFFFIFSHKIIANESHNSLNFLDFSVDFFDSLNSCQRSSKIWKEIPREMRQYAVKGTSFKERVALNKWKRRATSKYLYKVEPYNNGNRRNEWYQIFTKYVLLRFFFERVHGSISPWKFERIVALSGQTLWLGLNIWWQM